MRRVKLTCPEGLESIAERFRLRALTGDEMRLWQVVEVQSNTEYTVTMDYRMNVAFSGIIRPVVRGTNGEILADAGWATGYFQEMQDLRTAHGKGRARMTFAKGGKAALVQEASAARVAVPGDGGHDVVGAPAFREHSRDSDRLVEGAREGGQAVGVVRAG